MMSIFVGITSSDGYKTMLSHLGPDPLVRHLYLAVNLYDDFRIALSGSQRVVDSLWC